MEWDSNHDPSGIPKLGNENEKNGAGDLLKLLKDHTFTSDLWKETGPQRGYTLNSAAYAPRKFGYTSNSAVDAPTKFGP